MAKGSYHGPLEQVSETCWRIPRSYKEGMLVDGLIYADERLIDQIKADQAPEQVANVAFLPGIQHASLAMPDIHWGYGFCIGGVAATDPEEGGVISPGGVGYDINCGVRLMRSNLFYSDVKKQLESLMDALHAHTPAGVGREGKHHFKQRELLQLLEQGSSYLRGRGLATAEDIEHTEANGCIAEALPGNVSQRALQRGANQCGTLGSGNHFLEVQVVEAIFDEEAAYVMGLEKDMICVMIHSGSRGLGYQVCDDALKMLRGAPIKYGIDLPDQQLACAPIDSEEGQHYLGAMCAAANFAWCNRQLLMHQAREAFEKTFLKGFEALGLELVYDVAHNIAKLERHHTGGKDRQVWVHRKGATRAFPAGHPETPERYQAIGQPVLIPGDMGRASYVLAGQPGSMEHTFGTCCHGAGRQMSRTAAVKHAQGRDIKKELKARGVSARSHSWRGLAEEQPDAYKDVNQVVDVVHQANLAKKVARMRPIGVVKG
ncbi:RtcB family protein [Lignipirellula cremea]|uniref:tRNA-splicing ligase RtcB n=1 Tax=Lignipirellula cremea TaxID=2528010 RepID=A0A518E3H7_9BACT|nr:RtcB family protein [Lignipirellula cremea]QDU98641.1 RNA-splicing ligase RtcB [Lignipirellula cremea]